MLKTMHVVRFQPSDCSGAEPGSRSVAEAASRAVTELDSERSRGVSSAMVGEVGEVGGLSSSSRRREVKKGIVILQRFRIWPDGSRSLTRLQMSPGRDELEQRMQELLNACGIVLLSHRGRKESSTAFQTSFPETFG